MTSDTVTILTVNYKTADLVCQLIESISSTRSATTTMVVVDNDSGDQSYEIIRDYVSEKTYDWVHVIDGERNGGYAYGNNVGIEYIKSTLGTPNYLWFLNPDTQLKEYACSELISFLKENNVSIAGSRLEDEDGQAQISSFNFPSPFTEFSGGVRLGILDKLFRHWRIDRPLASEPECCDWLAGASVLMDWKVVDTIGNMDEDYFLYFEEVDYLLTAKRAGFDCWYVPSSRVYHAVGAATGISNLRNKAPRRPTYWFDSRRRFFLKNYGAITLLLADALFLFTYTTWFIRKSLVKSDELIKEPPHYLGDFFRNSIFVRGTTLN